MLRGCEYDGRSLNFFPDSDNPSENNKFTVIVGKNGTGKSRLLRAIVEAFVSVREPEGRERSFGNTPRRRPEMRISCETVPSRVIALSTSPFDRFPIKQGFDENEDDDYQYLGLRGLGSRNLSLSFMSRTLWALLSAVTFNRAQATTIQTALGYLGYAGFIEARFVCSMVRRHLEELLEANDPVDWLLTSRNRSNVLQQERFFYNLRRLSEGELRGTLDALRSWKLRTSKPRLDLRIDADGVYDIGAGLPFDASFLPLFKLGFFQLRDVGLKKEKHDSLIRITDASSGEQCVVMALLGIASHIRNGALICIDEPENCLHPEWQERYIQLLMTTFDQFRNCHFVIATHSPQVVAKLRDESCFVLDLESGITIKASELNGRSADFQLARVFKAPGFKNEYLSRVLFNALRLIGSGQILPADQAKEVASLLNLKDMLSKEDPVRGLMEILENALNEMGKA